MKYHFKIHKERSGGFWAECLELEGCLTQAESKQDLIKNLSEALNLFLSEPTDSKHIFPEPLKKPKVRNIISVEVHPSVAIANRIRTLRLKNKLTQMDMKDRLGVRHLSNYQRLEDPYKANPEWKTLFLLKKAFPQFHVDDLIAQ